MTPLHAANNESYVNDTGFAAERTPGDKAIKAIRCLNAISHELAEHAQNNELEQRFSKCVEDHLQSIHPGIMVFWSLRRKGTDEEISRTRRTVMIHDRDRKMLINQAIMQLNIHYDSIPFLESLIERNVGKSHVFSLSSSSIGMQFRAYSALKHPTQAPVKQSSCGVDVPSEEVVFASPSGEMDSFDNFLSQLNSQIDKCDPDMLLNNVRTRIRQLCDDWGKTAPQFLDKFSTREKPISLLELRHAVSHFVLLTLFAKNNNIKDITYILATTLCGQSASSMAVFWPHEDDVRYKDIGLPFQLQMILGTGVLRMLVAPRRVSSASYDLSHALKHRLGQLRSSVVEIEKVMGLSKDEYGKALYNLKMVADRCYRFAELTHLTHFALNSPERVYLEKSRNTLRFATTEPLNVVELLKMARDETRTRGDMIDIVWDETAAWTVRPYEKISSTSPVRLRDDLYRELVYELVNNALKHGRAVFDDSSEDTPPSAPAVSLQVYVTISPDSDGCALAFRNIIFDERTIQASLRAFISQHNIGVDTPIPIPIRWECNSPTGLECLSRVFDSIKAGEVYWRIWSTRGVYYFEVLVKLFGLTGCLQNPD